ncbi:MAG: class I tRNA ligase family protein, partial [Lachnospiraceae bacterium]|nr:class I tRNA ligase family protein [Lachnospiraceae bacterium]
GGYHFLNIDNKKMSKSLGNFFTVRDIAAKYELQVLRFFMLSAHYRSPLNFSDSLMESAKAGLSRIRNCVSDLDFRASKAEEKELSDSERDTLEKAFALKDKFIAAMDDDLNTADAISVIFELVKLANTETGEGSSFGFIMQLKGIVVELSGVLGLVVEEAKQDLDGEIEALIEERQQARKNRDFARADEIRDELLKKGIVLKDTREGVKWERV